MKIFNFLFSTSFSTAFLPTKISSNETCVGFLQLPDHVRLNFFRAKRACKTLVGGTLAYYDSKEEFEIFSERREGTGLGNL